MKNAAGKTETNCFALICLKMRRPVTPNARHKSNENSFTDRILLVCRVCVDKDGRRCR